MEARENLGKESENLKNYLSEINQDGMFFKGQMILGGILLGVLLIYFIWMA
ncbi:MAG: hypothetical protein R6W85_11615 [Gillisia sp.]